MNANRATNKVTAGYFDHFCSCNWKDAGELGAVVLAVAAVAGCIFSAAYLAAVGFALFGLSVIYFRYSNDSAEVQQLTGRMAQSDAQLKASQQRISQLTVQLTAAANTNKQTQAQMDQDVKQLKVDNSKLQADIQRLSAERQGLNESVSRLQQQSKQFATEANGWKKNCDNLAVQTKELLSQYGLLTAQMNPLSAAVGKLAITEKGIETASSSFKQDFTGEFNEIGEMLKAWKLRAEAFETDNKNLSSSVAELRETMGKTESEVALLKEENQKLTQQAASWKGDMDRLAKLDELLGKTANTTAQDINDIVENNRDLVQYGESLEERSKQLNEKELKLNEAMQAATEKLAQLTEQEKELTPKVAAAQKTFDELTAKIDQAKLELSNMKS